MAQTATHEGADRFVAVLLVHRNAVEACHLAHQDVAGEQAHGKLAFAGAHVVKGDTSAPAIYTFVDPQCPYCHQFVKDLRRDYIENGLIQVRMIPVGYKQGSMEQAAFLLAVPNPQGRWYRHIEGDEEALPVTPGINQQGVQRNMAIIDQAIHIGTSVVNRLNEHRQLCRV